MAPPLPRIDIPALAAAVRAGHEASLPQSVMHMAETRLAEEFRVPLVAVSFSAASSEADVRRQLDAEGGGLRTDLSVARAPGLPAADSPLELEVCRLRDENEKMRTEVQRLQTRIKELEARPPTSRVSSRPRMVFQ